MEPKATKSINTLVTDAATVIGEHGLRIEGWVQNLSTNKLYVKLGENCSTSDFSGIAVGGLAQDDGQGGLVAFTGYTGAISIAGTSPRCMVCQVIRCG